jgi:DNA-directed RNA polymerase subunit RPC12/RpoP
MLLIPVFGARLTWRSLQAVALLMTTVCGAAAPYIEQWSFDVEQFCQNCDNRVMYRARGKDVRVCKAPPAWKEESRYPDASLDKI